VHAGEHLELGDLKVCGRANAGKDSLRLASCAVYVEAELNHTFDYVLDLLVCSSVLHGNDHHWSPSRAVRMTAFPCECVRELRDVTCVELAFAAGD
jgi:hypothetical protein